MMSSVASCPNGLLAVVDFKWHGEFPHPTRSTLPPEEKPRQYAPWAEHTSQVVVARLWRSQENAFGPGQPWSAAGRQIPSNFRRDGSHYSTGGLKAALLGRGIVSRHEELRLHPILRCERAAGFVFGGFLDGDPVSVSTEGFEGFGSGR